jgi:hypothetical protein
VSGFRSSVTVSWLTQTDWSRMPPTALATTLICEASRVFDERGGDVIV